MGGVGGGRGGVEGWGCVRGWGSERGMGAVGGAGVVGKAGLVGGGGGEWEVEGRLRLPLKTQTAVLQYCVSSKWHKQSRAQSTG